jgi:hypothetical protein
LSEARGRISWAGLAALGAAAAALVVLTPGGVLAAVSPQEAAQGTAAAAEGTVSMRMYGGFPGPGPRVAIWVAAQVHLFFAAFVLGVPMFAVVAEAIGMFGGEQRYDKLAKEFTRLLLVSYSATAIWGAILAFGLITLYPGVWSYLAQVFAPSMWAYVGIFFFESFTLYLY